MSLEKNGRGQIAVLLVHIDLIKRGYQVFTEDTSQGLIDLVAIHLETGETRYFDVKCISKRKDGTRVCRTLKENQKKWQEVSGQWIQLVYADTSTYEVLYAETRRNLNSKNK